MAKKKTILDLQKMKENGEQAVWMVIYDACLASCAEEAGMDTPHSHLISFIIQ